MWHKAADTQLVEPGDLGFWKGLWKSDLFQSLMTDPRTGYAELLKKAALQPWWWVTPQHAYERKHFTVWFAQAIVRRSYDNPVMEDLYHFHDLLHALTFVDNPTGSEADWRLRMRADEVAVSIESELLIYARHPALRARSFPYDIWFDQLSDGNLNESQRQRLADYRARRQTARGDRGVWYERALREAHPAWALPFPLSETCDMATYDTLWDLRRAVTLDPDRSNPVEAMLADYEALSDPWSDAWADDWRTVEAERLTFKSMCAEGRWQDAVKRRHRHWERVSNEDGVPYGELAKLTA